MNGAAARLRPSGFDPWHLVPGLQMQLLADSGESGQGFRLIAARCSAPPGTATVRLPDDYPCTLTAPGLPVIDWPQISFEASLGYRSLFAASDQPFAALD